VVNSRRSAMTWKIARVAPGTRIALAAFASALVGCSATSITPAPAPTPVTSSSALAAKHSHLSGPIMTENGSTWTVKTATDHTYTVIITDTTAFGDTKNPATKGQFRVGDIAHVTGTMSGSTITASRISNVGNPLG
jgi:hypothetical protein